MASFIDTYRVNDGESGFLSKLATPVLSCFIISRFDQTTATLIHTYIRFFQTFPPKSLLLYNMVVHHLHPIALLCSAMLYCAL